MANGFGSLFVGASGLMSAQNSLNVTANNLANVDTKGYVREQVRYTDQNYITTKNPTKGTNMHQTGLGVSIGDVAHARDIFLDKAYRLETGRSAFYSTYYEVNTQVEDLFQELDGEQFKGAVGDFWQAFQELAKTPEDTTIQNLVLQKAELFLTRSQSLYSNLQSYQTNLNQQVADSVDKVNKLGNRIYELNNIIQKIESGGVETAMTYRDERDNLIDELASYGAVSYQENQFGFMNIDFEGVEFVDEMGCHNMGIYVEDRTTGFYTPYWPQTTDEASGKYTKVFKLDNISVEYETDIGKIKALLKARGDKYGKASDLVDMESYSKVHDCTVTEVEAQLDRLTTTIINTINDIYCPNTTYTSPDGLTYTVLDTENCARNKNGDLPPEELFVRIGQKERYTETYIDGQKFYVYNEPNPGDDSTWYAMGSVTVNDDLKKVITLMPAYRKDGAVNYEMANKLADMWTKTPFTLDPTDTEPTTFEGYYDKMISKLGSKGSVYKTAAETMESTVNSVENSRKQVTGVSSDEELTNLVKYQSAYNAASRYISVISEMTELIVTGLV